MSKPVGGASAVGCGVFGFGSVLLGVAISFWLASQALSGGGGSDDRPAPRRDGSELTANLEGLAPTPTSEPEGAAIAIDPPDGSLDRAVVSVSGTDLALGPLEIQTCLASGSGPAACDAGSAVPVRVAADGTFATPVTLRRVIVVDGTPYDCAARAGACVLAGVRRDGGYRVSAPIAFAAGLPPVDGEAPPG